LGVARQSEVEEILETLEKALLNRIPMAYRRSPERLFRELSALDLVMRLKDNVKERN